MAIVVTGMAASRSAHLSTTTVITIYFIIRVFCGDREVTIPHWQLTSQLPFFPIGSPDVFFCFTEIILIFVV